MPVTRTSRFSLHRWDSGADPFNRSQMDTDNLQVETLAALFRTGPAASIGDPTSASYAKSFYYATDTLILYFCTGSLWIPVSDFGEEADITKIEPDATKSAGTVTDNFGVRTAEVALADHRHSIVTEAPIAVGTSLVEGTATSFSRSDHQHTLDSGSVSSTAILADNIITAAKMQSDSITTTKIVNLNVTADKLASNAVTTGKILNANVTAVKLASDVAGDGLTSTSGVLSVNVDASTIEINAGTLRIKNGGVTAAKLNSDIAGTGLTSTSGVLSVNVDSSTIELSGGSLRLKDDGIAAAKLKSDSVTTAKIVNLNVTADKLSADSVTTAKIVNLNVTTDKLAANAVTTAKLAGSAVTATELAPDAVTTAKILNANVTLAKLASASVNSSKLAAGVYYNATNNATGGQIRYGTTAIGGIGGSPTAGDLYFKYV